MTATVPPPEAGNDFSYSTAGESGMNASKDGWAGSASAENCMS